MGVNGPTFIEDTLLLIAEPFAPSLATLDFTTLHLSWESRACATDFSRRAGGISLRAYEPLPQKRGRTTETRVTARSTPRA